MFKINYHPAQVYSEIGQSSNLKFSLGILNKETNEIDEKFYRFKCRDFFNEIVWKQWNGEDWPIYAFQTKNFPVVKDEQVVLLTYGGTEDQHSNIMDALVEFDPNIKSYEIDDVLVSLIPTAYIRYTFMISYLTFLMRCVERFPDSVFDSAEWDGNEKNYASGICLMTKRSLKEVHDAFKYYAANVSLHLNTHCGLSDVSDVSTNHNCTGIVSVLTNPNNGFRVFCDKFWSEQNV